MKTINLKLMLLTIFAVLSTVQPMVAMQQIDNSDDELDLILDEAQNDYFESKDEEIKNDEELIDAAKNKDLAKVRQLLEAGRNPNSKQSYHPRYTPLMYAAENHDIDMMKLLLNYKPRINMQNGNHETALTLAVENDNYITSELLLQHGAGTDIQNHAGMTPLIIAVDQKNIPLIELLLGYGARKNVVDFYGDTALIRAVLKDRFDIAKMTVNKDSVVYLPNKQYERALALASKFAFSNDDIVNYLSRFINKQSMLHKVGLKNTKFNFI